jgi:hypothetical protein
MPKNVDEIVVGANGSIYTAPKGSELPASISEPLGEAFTDAGYVTEDGVTFTDSKDVEEIKAWQSFYALRRIVTGKEAKAVFALMQWSGANVILAFGGGDVEEIAAPVDDSPGPAAPGEYRYHPPAPEHLAELMLVIEWSDGDKDYRLSFPNGSVSEAIETNLTRSGPGLLPITFSLLGQDGVDPWTLDTNDPAFADVAA